MHGRNAKPMDMSSITQYIADTFTDVDVVVRDDGIATQSWICVLNPGAETFQQLEPLLAEAYELAISRRAGR
jgi:hypothetical protein